MVGLNLFEVIEIIDHQTKRLPEPLWLQVGARIDAFKTGAVVEVESCNWVGLALLGHGR